MVKKLKVFLIGFAAVILIIAYPMDSFSQIKSADSSEKAEPTTKLEQFLAKKGVLFVKDFYLAGAVAGQPGQYILIKSVIVYEPGKEVSKIRGLKIEVNEGGRLSKKHSSFLDLEEAESLSKAIDYMTKLAEEFKKGKREYTEVIFSTRGGFQAGFYQSENIFDAFAESGIIAKATSFFPLESLYNFKSIVDKGISLAKK